MALEGEAAGAETADLEVTEEQKADLMRFVKEDGKAILVAHSGTDSFRDE